MTGPAFGATANSCCRWAAEVLTDLHSLAYLGAPPQLAAAIGAQFENLVIAYRTGGVSWAELGDNARNAQAALNRPWL